MRILLPAFAMLSLAAAAAQEPVGKTSEVGMRRLAVSAPLPSYPAASVKAGAAGVAVAEVVADATGAVSRVEILEAPDPQIADAVQAALRTWKFQAFVRPLQSRMTFYFRIERGIGRVLGPGQMPGGPTIERPKVYAPGAVPVTKPAAGPATVVLSEPKTTMTFEELQKLAGPARPTILDVGERAAFKRGHMDGAINIPSAEIAVRGPIELRSAKAIVIDCTQEASFSCLVAEHVLTDAGFRNVAILRR